MSEIQPIFYPDKTFRLIRAPTMQNVLMIEGFYHRMQTAMDRYRLPQWPPDLDVYLWYHHLREGEPWPAELVPTASIELEEFCYEQLGYYYHKIVGFLQCEQEPLGYNWIEGATLTSVHEFFVATEEVQHWERDELIPGLSRLRQMLGHRYPDPNADDGDYEPLPSGLPISNIIANLCVGFDGTGPEHWLKISPFLGQCILKDANEIRRRGEEEAKKGKKPKRPRQTKRALESGEDRSDFAAVKQFIEAQLVEWGIEYPKDF